MNPGPVGELSGRESRVAKSVEKLRASQKGP
jgi:hypothetical protein